MWMRERRNSASLAQKARAKVTIFRAGPRVYRLDRDAPAEHGVFGKIDHTHSALAKFFENAIVRECASDQ